jgi:hypothetical protein
MDPVQQAVDAICNQGCTYVDQCIDALEAGRPVAEVNALTVGERAAVLNELRTVMVAYRWRNDS